MVECQSIIKVPVIWRGKKLIIEINSEASLKELGVELQTLTDVKADTIRLIIPQPSTKSSNLFMPFSDEHSNLRLQEIGVMEGKPIRMMGVSENEIDRNKDAKQNLRIAGFEEEDKRMKQRISGGSYVSLKLPQGPYIFGDFHTLELPGVVLNPPPSEALKRMHMLAADPGIVAIMNKHRWRVGIMTEMAPIGYVGISPKCILGFNKNHGEEISLRLRTDDLKGFRKYESIKKTLLHELAHMVFSEHDANFYALDKQLNQEAFALDWTKSQGHTLTDTRSFTHDDMDLDFDLNINLPHKLGGESSLMSTSARIASVAAAYNRLSNCRESSDDHDVIDPNRDDHEGRGTKIVEIYPDVLEDSSIENPDPNEHEQDDSDARDNIGNIVTCKRSNDSIMEELKEHKVEMEPDPDDGQENKNNAGKIRGDSDYTVEDVPRISDVVVDEPDPDDELRRIEDPATLSFNRLNKAIELLRIQLDPSEALTVLQTLFRIIRNVSENPNEMKYKRLRKGNPVLQRSVANYPAAMEVLSIIGFIEEVINGESGNAESYLVLKRNDPGLLWLAKSSLESSIAM